MHAKIEKSAKHTFSQICINSPLVNKEISKLQLLHYYLKRHGLHNTYLTTKWAHTSINYYKSHIIVRNCRVKREREAMSQGERSKSACGCLKILTAT